jgi:hypothetical protein
MAGSLFGRYSFIAINNTSGVTAPRVSPCLIPGGNCTSVDDHIRHRTSTLRGWARFDCLLVTQGPLIFCLHLYTSALGHILRLVLRNRSATMRIHSPLDSATRSATSPLQPSHQQPTRGPLATRSSNYHTSPAVKSMLLEPKDSRGAPWQFKVTVEAEQMPTSAMSTTRTQWTPRRHAENSQVPDLCPVPRSGDHTATDYSLSEIDFADMPSQAVPASVPVDSLSPEPARHLASRRTPAMRAWNLRGNTLEVVPDSYHLAQSRLPQKNLDSSKTTTRKTLYLALVLLEMRQCSRVKSSA